MEKKELSEPEIKVLIVEDHKLLAETYEKIFASQDHIKIVNHATSKEEAIAILEANREINLVLMDLFLGVEENQEEPMGLQTCREIKTRINEELKIIIVTSEIDGKWIWKAYDMRVEGYVPKKEGSQDLLDAIEHVSRGKRYYKNEISDAKDAFHSTLNRLSEEKITLTKSESEILQMISKGFTTPDIAKFRGCVVGTVDIHRNNIFKKLGAANAPEAVRIAIERELIR